MLTLLSEEIYHGKLLDDVTCTKLLGIINSSQNWNQGEVITNNNAIYNPKERKVDILYADFFLNRLFYHLIIQLNSELSNILNQYEIIINKKLNLPSLHVLRYTKGGKYEAHRDSVPHPYPQRQFTVIIYLNDNFVGGETSILDKDLKISPKKGNVLIFNSAYLHKAHKVTEGIKFALVGWYEYS
jgi:Rps23 Pro-64 3,4-dihydroxylase Tpa1-like proline 4-hydroxylase